MSEKWNSFLKWLYCVIDFADVQWIQVKQASASSWAAWYRETKVWVQTETHAAGLGSVCLHQPRWGWVSRLDIFCFIIFSSPESKAHWWAYRICRRPSSVVVVRRCPHSLNIFSSETTGPVKVKFHMELLWDGGTKVCSNGPGHMTKLAATPIHDKNLKQSSPEPKGRWPWYLVCSIGCLSTTKFVQTLTPGWLWPILRQCQIWSLMLLFGKKVKQWIFQKLL